MRRTDDEWELLKEGFLDGYQCGYKDGSLKQAGIALEQDKSEMKRKIMESINPETVEKSARERADEYIEQLKHAEVH
jgi:hypothetical protein